MKRHYNYGTMSRSTAWANGIGVSTTFYYIIDATGNRVLFQPNDIQHHLNQNLWYLNLILKSRQHGITTDICILYLDYCLFTPNIRAGIIAHTRDDAEIFFNDKIKYAYDNLPDQVKGMVPADSRSARELSFGNNSAIRVGTSLRGSTLQLLHISEFGKICAKYPDKAKEIVTGSINTVQALKQHLNHNLGRRHLRYQQVHNQCQRQLRLSGQYGSQETFRLNSGTAWEQRLSQNSSPVQSFLCHNRCFFIR
jgi:hypothetical protein